MGSVTHAARLQLFALVWMTLVTLKAVLVLGTSLMPITLVVVIASVHWWAISSRTIIGSAIGTGISVVTMKPAIALKVVSIEIVVALRKMIPRCCLRSIRIWTVILIGILTVVVMR